MTIQFCYLCSSATLYTTSPLFKMILGNLEPKPSPPKNVTRGALGKAGMGKVRQLKHHKMLQGWEGRIEENIWPTCNMKLKGKHIKIQWNNMEQTNLDPRTSVFASKIPCKSYYAKLNHLKPRRHETKHCAYDIWGRLWLLSDSKHPNFINSQWAQRPFPIVENYKLNRTYPP